MPPCLTMCLKFCLHLCLTLCVPVCLFVFILVSYSHYVSLSSPPLCLTSPLFLSTIIVLLTVCQPLTLFCSLARSSEQTLIGVIFISRLANISTADDSLGYSLSCSVWLHLLCKYYTWCTYLLSSSYGFESASRPPKHAVFSRLCVLRFCKYCDTIFSQCPVVTLTFMLLWSGFSSSDGEWCEIWFVGCVFHCL